MTKIIENKFSDSAKVCMEMDAADKQLWVFHLRSDGDTTVEIWPLDIEHMAIAVAYYQKCCNHELSLLG